MYALDPMKVLAIDRSNWKSKQHSLYYQFLIITKRSSYETKLHTEHWYLLLFPICTCYMYMYEVNGIWNANHLHNWFSVSNWCSVDNKYNEV